MTNEIETTRYERNPFYVDVVEVTTENLDPVAAWCKGEVRTVAKPEGVVDEKYIKVPVISPQTQRQTKAFIGDFILHAGTGYKVYTRKAFEKGFRQTVDRSAYRDAKSGHYVSADYARENPDSTVRESMQIKLNFLEAFAAGVSPGQAPVFMTPDEANERLKEI